MPLGTPYATPDVLQNSPTGASWEIIPSPGASPEAVKAALTDVAWRATSVVDTFCHQVLRSTADVEYLNGPGQARCSVDQNTGNGVLVMHRWPVTQVLAIQLSAARSFPRTWSPVPSGKWDIHHPLIGLGDSASATAPDGGMTIDVAPGYISWQVGRGGQRVQVCYINGWPHTSLTAASIGDAATLDVDDVTGWAGASGFAYDGSSTEQLSVVSVEADSPLTLPDGAGTVQAGPGTITLSSPLTFGHDEGIMISALPANVIQGAILAAAVQALTGGYDALAVQAVGGGESSTGADTDTITADYMGLLLDYVAVI